MNDIPMRLEDQSEDRSITSMAFERVKEVSEVSKSFRPNP